MFRRFIYFLIIFSFLILPFYGCASMLERQFISVEEHASPSESDETPLIVELSTYEDLRDTLISLIKEHVFMQTIRLIDYPGDVEQDVQLVVREVMDTPLGAFAVNYIFPRSSRILSYYEISFDINYRRTAQEVQDIIEVSGVDEFTINLRDRMSKFTSVMTYSTNDYKSSLYNIESMFLEIYYKNPKSAYGFESIEVYTYPETETDLNCIIEIEVSYTQSPSTLSAKSKTAADEAQIIFDSYTDSPITANKIKYFHDMLSSSVNYDFDTMKLMLESEHALSKTDSFTAYGAFIKHLAVGEGFALAFKQLCDMAEINCTVVAGKLDGVSHMWNMVNYLGEWFHIDCSADTLGNGEVGYGYFAVTDETISQRYTWDKNTYSPCTSDTLRSSLNLDPAMINANRYEPASANTGDENSVSTGGGELDLNQNEINDDGIPSGDEEPSASDKPEDGE